MLIFGRTIFTFTDLELKSLKLLYRRFSFNDKNINALLWYMVNFFLIKLIKVSYKSYSTIHKLYFHLTETNINENKLL